ncbi:Ras-related protein Rab-21 [Microtus ochrogaster]|uniref:Ras-related protein Rab-21 n=1 Tax=Microtus ochrogaster TaxID=79684 RepID=A0A8J6FZ98_MICOH|nr:Ras-related protein Rab-21 [Microtus ochrogaster]
MAAAGGGAAAGRAYSFKVVLLGEGCVGKTSLVLRYCENKFNDKHITTLQDTAGQERFHALGPIYYRDSNGAILVYDITDEDSFQKSCVVTMRYFSTAVCSSRGITGSLYSTTVLEVFKGCWLVKRYADSVGAKHYHTSAKQNKGIEELFLDLCKRMIETAQVDERAKGNGASQGGAARRGVQIIDDEPQAQSGSGGCCSSG